jgi:hypothetical protein
MAFKTNKDVIFLGIPCACLRSSHSRKNQIQLDIYAKSLAKEIIKRLNVEYVKCD